MRRLSIRIRFSLTIGLMICLFSLVSIMFTVSDIKSSIKDYETSVNDSALKVETIMNSETETIEENEKVAGTINTEDSGAIPSESIVIEDTKSKVLLNNYTQAINLIEKTQSEIIVSEILFSILMGVIGILVAYPISVLLLKPFRELSADIEAVTANDLKTPLIVENESDDLGKLKKSFNVMLERLHGSFERQKRFSSNAAHELKTPLAVIKTNLQILDEDSDIEEYQDTFEIVNKNVDRMSVLVNDFMEYARDEAPQLGRVNIRKTIDDVLIELKSLSDKKNIKVYMNVKDVEIMSNEGLYKRLVYNLVNNAISYNKDNGSIYIDADERELVIRDTGIGIPKEMKEKIFERFAQVDKSTYRKKEGSGIGLSLVKSLVELQGGSINIDSEINKGSTFTVKLPIARVEESENILPQSAVDANIEKIKVEFSDIYN